MLLCGVLVPAGGGDVSVDTGRSLQCSQEVVLCRVPRAVAGDRGGQTEKEYSIDHSEDRAADQLQARRRAVECEYTHRRCYVTYSDL